MSKRIVVIGGGYVGLVSGACLAELGHRVTIIERDSRKVAILQGGGVPIHEPGLAELIAKCRDAGRLDFTDHYDKAQLAFADAAFICVGTPSRPFDNRADTSSVFAAAGDILKYAGPRTVIVVKSTVPVGTGDEIAAMVAGAGRVVAGNPEFLREGSAIGDFMSPDRIVIGTEDEQALEVLTEIYRGQTDAGAPLVSVSRREAELIKYAANSFLAIKITFINEIANLCEAVGADVDHIASGIGLDRRIGRNFLKAGPGFGGSCFPKDMVALMGTAHDHGVSLRTLETAILVNDARKGEMIRKIVQAAGGSVAGRTIAVLGLAFKAGTDDMRSAPSLTILPGLVRLGARIVAYDPEAMDAARPLLPEPEVTMAGSAMDAARGADLAVILTEWPEFASMDFESLVANLNAPTLVDLRNIVDRDAAARAGLTLIGIGKPAPLSGAGNEHTPAMRQAHPRNTV
ncbi:MAG: UDP-glucose/GDP-mannose dehydrogenase family protein [Alphaproteobacteria bacterium]